MASQLLMACVMPGQIQGQEIILEPAGYAVGTGRYLINDDTYRAWRFHLSAPTLFGSAD